MGEIRELFVLALSLVWFAGVTPEMHALKFPPMFSTLNGPTTWWLGTLTETSGHNFSTKHRPTWFTPLRTKLGAMG